MKELNDKTLDTIRQLYGEAQNWARYYEQTIVNAGVLIISACLIFVGLAFGDKATSQQSVWMLGIAGCMNAGGIVLTLTLFRMYAICVERMIRYEDLLDCYDVALMKSIDGKGSLLPVAMQNLPVRRSILVNFFLALHGFLILVYLVIGTVRFTS